MKLMRADDRIAYVDKQIWVVLEQMKDKKVEVRGAFMEQIDAQLTTNGIKAAGGYAWYRNVEIE